MACVLTYEFIGGSTECNNFNTSEVNNGRLELWATALNNQEQKFIETFNELEAHEFGETDALVLEKDDGRSLMARQSEN